MNQLKRGGRKCRDVRSLPDRGDRPNRIGAGPLQSGIGCKLPALDYVGYSIAQGLLITEGGAHDGYSAKAKRSLCSCR